MGTKPPNKQGRRSFSFVWFILFTAGGAVGLISLLAIGALFAMLFARPVASDTSTQPQASTRIIVPARTQSSRTAGPTALPATPRRQTANQNVEESAQTGQPGEAPTDETKPPAYIAPRPLKRALPNASLLPPGTIEGPVRVEVLVKINEKGRVTDALITNGSNISEGLANAVLNAAKRWTFAPATRGGKPVASDHTIAFQFGGPAAK